LKRPAPIPTFLVLLVVLLLSPQLQATTNYCANDTARHFIRVKTGKLDQARLDTTTPAQVEITSWEFNSAWMLDSEKPHTRSIGFNFRYTIVDLESLNAMTNGHLHTWDFPLEGRLENAASEWFYHITPAISVSSNALKNTGLIDSDGLQLYAGMVYKKNFSLTSAWLLGLRSDHRFGSYKAYPVVGFCMQVAEDWSLQLALPDFAIQKRINSDLSLTLYAEPIGHQWHVFSKDTTRESDFIYSATAIGFLTQWHISTSANVSLAIEQQTDRRLGFELNDSTPVALKAASSTGIMLKAEVLF